MLFLRSKLVPSTAPNKLLQQYEGFNITQLGNDATITEYVQQLQKYQIVCKDKQRGEMISNHALKWTFMNGLRSNLKLVVRTQINYNISFDDIVGNATGIAYITKLAQH